MADSEGQLAQQLLQGVEALRRGRYDEAIRALEPVCDHPELAAAADLVDIRARAHSLLAQALLEGGQAEEAQRRLSVAQRLAMQVGDAEALPQLGELGERIQAELARGQGSAAERAKAERLAAMTVEQLEALTRTPEALVEVLVRKANAESDRGRTEAALEVAERALVGAMTLGEPRLEVLARLSIARAAPGRAPEEVTRAWACADRSGETGLITAVARSAELHGVELPKEPGGGRPL